MTTTFTSNRPYPGMTDSGLEFFVVDANHQDVKVIHAQSVYAFEDLSFPIVQMLKEEVQKDPEVQRHLQAMQPDSEIAQLKQFVACRFGGLDRVADIADGKLAQGDYWNCPLRGSCKSEGILCKSLKWNDVELTPEDIKLIQLTTTTMTNEVIAEQMNLPLGSLHKLKQFLYQKLEVQTKQEVAIVAMFLNLI